jgi:autotransporter adhesin
MKMDIMESGHAKNMANFDELITYVVGYGTIYKPNKSSIQLVALQTLQPKVHNAMTTVNQLNVVLIAARAARKTAFAPLSKLITRIVNAEKASDTNLQTHETVKSLVRMLRGEHSKAKSTQVIAATAPATGSASTTTTVPSATTVSTGNKSHVDKDTVLNTLDKLIQTLIGIPEYKPFEADITTDALRTLYNDLHAKNAAVVTAHAQLSNANIARYEICYKPNTGMVDLTSDVKSYVKSVYGAVSPQYKQISKLKFKNFSLI